ncbi:sensor histidine kinase [Labilibaculum euxinus]
MKIVSHDLQGALVQMYSASSILRKTMVCPNNLLIKLEEKAFYSQNLLSNLFQMVISPTRMLNRKEVNIRIMFDRIINLFSWDLDKKNIQVVFVEQQNMIVFVDEVIMETICRNLISNAIKFSFENSCIEIDYRVSEGYLLIDVKDFGIGMDEDVVTGLLECNQCVVSNRGTMNEKGNGIGLGIVKELVHKCNGEIDIISKKGEGTIIKLIFLLK